MKNNYKQVITKSLMPIAALCLIIGILMFDSIKWLKYTFFIVAIILSLISIILQYKNKINNKE